MGIYEIYNVIKNNTHISEIADVHNRLNSKPFDSSMEFLRTIEELEPTTEGEVLFSIFTIKTILEEDEVMSKIERILTTY